MSDQYEKVALEAIEAATRLVECLAALDVLTIATRADREQYETTMRKVRESLKTAL